ncbi:hypothetical protein BATDEDRAFT_25111 [Batrachochytrium dendrobatidis JAM81]|uniref:Nascent polypeptide-associated complex subunit beta n=2 Tax=Batrachochytrium dendrobatidis TaxID=109871 RepID=F4P2M8_BATDJ|nr:uncharacterized protein BATDEDRAFT_25111 [Batrachochytrium dendrobatidis JAM81]EGF80488.1 hypothetical protein BATDEDRAFT_25111 [Batrachochytrium dendrobatidis JAM81]KAJ8326341.1 Nascent polypeptide-associated complex subunit beta [Batrachochytrium dendrobatidis]KAK5670123.1 Nascent polypeptide-associated complex subunit beta [Batrachochytrium dendrobatidis]OAJ40975.1 hypothetical protein BDEG_24646 [Batrachochytrium dendrobatidis JEL423]|eukprot:XP_006679021.1 hypothetical protein BATDEDRAFT_25111 [Batrachochytrium dendrobatidis JAM81]
MNAEKLAKLQAQVRIGGKGTPRRKVKKIVKSSGTDDKKLQAALKKLNVQPVTGIEEVNMFSGESSVLHFSAPKVQASVACNTFVINGVAETKDITDLIPGILNQLGPESLNSLRKFAENFSAQAAAAKGEDDDEVPDLVESENFE